MCFRCNGVLNGASSVLENGVKWHEEASLMSDTGFVS